MDERRFSHPVCRAYDVPLPTDWTGADAAEGGESARPRAADAGTPHSPTKSTEAGVENTTPAQTSPPTTTLAENGDWSNLMERFAALKKR